MGRFGELGRKFWPEAAIVLLVIEAMIEVASRRHDPGAPRSPLWFALPALAVAVSPLLGRRHAPFVALTGFWLLATALTFVDGRLIPFLTSLFVLAMVAAFLLGNLSDAVQARTGLAVVVIGATTVVYNSPRHAASQLLVTPVLFGICWLAGDLARQRSDRAEAAEARARQAERDRDAATRVAVAEERARIARELHDIVAHAVSVMVLQAGAVRHKLPEPLSEARTALKGVEQAGRSALSEMRHLLDATRQEGEQAERGPQPGLDRLDALLQDVGRAGLSVHVHVEGDPFQLPPGIDISAYRIAQEGLTNVLKHARATDADVTLHYAPDQFEIQVSDNGRGAAPGDGRGHGLIGIRERVKLYGGEMTAGTNGGGFTLRARLPLLEYPA
ncbi:MAG TPA: sensor histidine kinase [Acidimicrobiales bacterium]|nr:sensor histidine kinase [Acidimicrobiales bacterium]